MMARWRASMVMASGTPWVTWLSRVCARERWTCPAKKIIAKVARPAA
jgi:hypothetical protein